MPVITGGSTALKPFFTTGVNAVLSNPQRVRYPSGPQKEEKWILDVDGTLFTRRPGGRGPFDWDRVIEDDPNTPVIRVVRAMAMAGEGFVVVSGRLDVCRRDTETALQRHVFVGTPLGAWTPDDLLMRDKAREFMPDHELKKEILYRDIIPRYNVIGAIDDRNRVVEMWRQEGIFCMQVADGNF